MKVNHVAPFEFRVPGLKKPNGAAPLMNGAASPYGGDPVWLKKQPLQIREQFEKGDTFEGGESIESESITAAESENTGAKGRNRQQQSPYNKFARTKMRLKEGTKIETERCQI